MPLKVSDRHKFSDAVIKSILEIHDRTKHSGKENLISLCKTKTEDEVLEPSSICEGTVCQVEIKPCENYYGGDVHTHPSHTTNPSSGDLLNLYWNALTGGIIGEVNLDYLTHKTNDVIGCRIGEDIIRKEPEMRCEYFQLSALDRQMMTYMYRKYSRISRTMIQPLYDEWVKTGTYPKNHPLAKTYCETENEIVDALLPQLETESFYLNRLAKELGNKQ